MASLDVFPATTDTRAGREGSTLAIMTTLSPPDGLHNINLTTLESMRDFPTFAPDIQLKSGKWYYEVEIHSVNGALCIGYVTKGFVSTGRQNGVGDCKNSWGLDVGQSKLYNANVGEGKSEYKAKAGDVVGVSIDVDTHTIIWSINGTSVATVADFTQGSSYVVGNSVQPGVSIAQRQKVKWNFTADSFKFAPAGFEPLQAVPFPPVYSLDPKTLSPPDLLSDTTLLTRLLEQYAPTSTAADEKTIGKWLETRGFGMWEYGFNTSCVNSITNKIKEASNAFEGELPKLAYKRGSFARDWEAAEEEFDKIEVLRRALTQWTVVFMTLWGRETAAGPTVEKIKGLDTLFKTSLAEANLKRRFVAARENRKTNGFCEYGIQYSIGGVVNTMKEDRSRMDANKLKAFVEELGQKIAKLRGWRAWFVAQVGDIPFHTTQLDELDALIAQYDAMFDPKAMEKEAIAKALERCTKDLENVVRIGRSNIKDALAEFARFPERAEEKYRTMNEQLEKYKADAAAAAASGEEPTAASVAALGVAAVTDTPLFKEWQGELSAATANWRVAEDRRRLEREAQDATRECKGLISRGHDLLYHSNIPAALEHLHEAREKVAELKLRPGFLSLPLVNEFFTEYEAEKYKLETGITAWQLDRATSDAARELRDAADHTLYLFSHYRNEEALENHYKTETLRKEMEAKREWAAVPAIKEILERVKPQSVQFIRDYKERVVTRQAEDAVRECDSAFDFAKGHLDHHRHEMCLDELQKCKDKTEALRNDAMLSTIPVAVAWLARYAEEVPALQRKYDSIMLQREIDEALRQANGAFDEVEDHFNHYRFEYALTSLEKYRSLGDQLDKEKRFAGDAKVEEFLGKFDSNIANFTTRYRDTMLKREYDEKIRSANDTINNADHLFSHSRFEEAIAALQVYRDLLTELSASKYDSITERDEYVRVAREEKIPAWLTKYKAEVLSRKGAEVARELSMAASTAKDHFSHHRDELFLAALDVLRQKMKEAEPAKDDTGDARMTYELPAVQDALKEAATAVWEMSQAYNQRTQDKKVDEALRNIRTLLDQANYLFSHSRFDESLSEFAKARDAAADLSSAAFAAGVARVSEYLTTFATSAKEFETKFDEGMRARRRAEAERAVNMAFSSAKDMFAHYRNDDSLKELNKASEAVLTFESEFTKPEDVAAVEAWRAGFATFEQEYNSRVLTREAEDAVAKAKAELTFAEGHSDHSRFENALESLQASLAAAAAIAVNARFRSLPVVVAFEAEFAPRVGAFKVAFERKMQDRQASELLRGLTDALGEMEQHFQHHRMQNALESFAAVKEKRAALQVEPLSQRPDVVAAYGDAGKRMDTFQQNYRESVLATKLRESTSAALAKLTEAEDMLKHSRFDESLESFQTSRELAGAVGADEMLNGMAAVESFLKDFGVRAEAFRSLHSSTVRARAQAEGRRVIGGDLDLAKQHFDHSRNEDALLSLSKARDALSAFEVEWAGSDAAAATFVSESRATMASLEKAFAEKMFKQELERKMGKARSRLTASSDALAHHRHDEAMRVLVEADESAAVLASDERFLRLEAVDAFLKEHKAASQELRAKIDASLKEKAAAEVSRTARDLAGEAERLYEHHRLEEALANASKLKSLIEDDLAPNPLLTALAGELTTRLRTFQERFQREHLAREADSLIRGADSQLESARFLLDHHRAEEALEAVQKARDFAATLGDDVRFGGVAAVDAFFAAWAGRVSATCAAITDRMLSRRARDAIADVRSPLTEATQYLDKNVYEQALERLSQATDRATALRDDKELSKVESVRTFLSEFDKERSALAARVAREVYGKEVDAALRAVRGHLDAATVLFDRFAFEEALKAFHEASDAVDVVRADERLAKAEAWVAFATGEWKQRSAAFAQKYSERVLGDEARTLANEVRALIAKAKIFLERNVRDKTEEALDEARKAAAPLLDSNGLLQALDVATAVKNELAAIQLAFAQQYLVAEATAALTAARKQLQLAARAQTRALSADESLTAAREAVDALLGPSAEEPIKPLFAALPEVAAFVNGELAPALAGAGLELFKKVAGGAAGGAGGKGGKVDTVDAALGPRFPQLAALRKGLPQIPVDTSVHPKYFSALKVTNMAAKSIQGQLKQLETAVKACDLSLDAEHPTALFANEVATYPIESIERSLIDFGKGVAQVQEFKDEELAQQLINGLESFTAVFRESVAVLKKFSSLTAKARAMVWCKNLLAKMMAEGDAITQSSQPQIPELRGFAPGHNPLNLGFEKHDDATFLLFVEATALKSASMLQGWVDGEFAGVAFPRKDQFLEGFAATAVEAKRKHALHCILRLQQLWWNKKEVREPYMQALARFPLARAEALARYKNYTEFVTERRDDLNDRDELVDPWADGGAPDADADEKPEWYLEDFVLVQPGPSNGLALNKLQEQTADPNVYTAARKALDGRIVFSAAPIADTGDAKDAPLSDKFNLAEVTAGRGLFARAFWPHSLRNYALAKRRDNGAPIYGPEFLHNDRIRAEIMVFVRIDGKEIKRDNQPYGSFTWFTESCGAAAREGKKYKLGTTGDFWAWNQTCRLSVLRDDVHLERRMAEDWEASAARFAYEFSKLSAGDHKVEIDLRWRAVPTSDARILHKDKRTVFLNVTSELSEPLATGSFTLVVPATPVPRRSVLPITNPALSGSKADLETIEKALLKHMGSLRDWGRRSPRTEEPLICRLQSETYESEYAWFAVDGQRGVVVKEAVQRARDFVAAFRRLKKTGWERDSVAFFTLAAYGVKARPPSWDSSSITGIGVAMGGHFSFDLELLSEADLALLS